jgi:hypothetical protein
MSSTIGLLAALCSRPHAPAQCASVLRSHFAIFFRNPWGRCHPLGRARYLFAIGLLVLLTCRAAVALDQSVPRIGGDLSRNLMGDGTGVIIGILDSGIDATHPALAGNDSRGLARLVAESNFVTTEPANTGADPHGHGTGVAGVALGSDPTYRGPASDARFVNARVLNANNAFQTTNWVINGAGFAIGQGAHVLNLSLNVSSTTSSSGTSSLDRMLDWAAYDQGIVSAACVANVLSGAANNLPRSPGGAFNVISVGQTASPGYNQLHSNSTFGPTSDGRSKPDLVAPGRSITTANTNWETQADFVDWGGCSFATPHVAGMLAQQIEYGTARSLLTDPLVLKATMLNSAEKVRRLDGSDWRQVASLVNGVWEVTQPLDNQLGAGQIDGLALFRQYRAGRHAPGDVPLIGWDYNMITGVTSGSTNTRDYTIDIPRASPDTLLTATLAWNRHVVRTDNGNGVIDASDTFTLGAANDALDNLDLSLLVDGNLVAISKSTVDNVEHLHWQLSQAGAYTLRVSRLAVNNSGNGEAYALAWYVVPEPSSLALALAGLAAIAINLRRTSRRRVAHDRRGPSSADELPR